MKIVIPEFGHRSMTKDLVDCIPDDLLPDVYIGNDGYLEPQEPIDKVNIINWGDNVGFARNVNRTASEAYRSDNDEVLIIINNDVILEPEVLEQLADFATETGGIVGPGIIVPIQYSLKHAQLMSIDNMKAGIHRITAASGACMAMTYRIWYALEGFDSTTFRAYFEDDDLCIRAQRDYGIPVTVNLDIKVCHEVGQTYVGTEQFNTIMESKKAFHKKYPDIKWDYTGEYEI